MTNATVAQLRTHVQALNASFGAEAPVRLKPLSTVFAHWLRQLVRVVDCADLDTLMDAFRSGSELLAAVEQLHRNRAVSGIVQMRKAFAGIETVLDQMPMAEPGKEPKPDAALDLPSQGLLATLLQRFARASLAPVRRPAMASRVKAGEPPRMGSKRVRAKGFAQCRKAA